MVNRYLKGLAIGCATLFVVTIIAVVGGAVWLQRTYTTARPPEPKVGKTVAFKIGYQRRRDNKIVVQTSAWAGRIEPGVRPVVVTPLRALGPETDFATANIAPAEVAAQLRSAVISPYREDFGGAIVLGQPYSRPGPPLGPFNENDVSADVTFFRLPDKAPVNSLTLARKDPALGESVWVVGAEGSWVQRLIPARVLTVSDKALLLAFDRDMQLMSWSGPPVVNAKGEAVGMLVAGQGNGGVGIPVTSIRARMRESGIP